MAAIIVSHIRTELSARVDIRFEKLQNYIPLIKHIRRYCHTREMNYPAEYHRQNEDVSSNSAAVDCLIIC